MPRAKTTKKAEVQAPTEVSLPRKRGFDAARLQPTLGFLPSLYQSFQEDLKRDLPSLRSRSRDASLNDPFAKRYFKCIVQNVVGPHGISLKMGIKTPGGTPDTIANQLLESRWQQFSKAVTTDGKNLRETLKLVLETTARDGECFIVMRKGNFGKYFLQLQVYEAEHCDLGHNEITRDGNEIRSGIEYDAYNRVVAYHLFRYHPNSTTAKTLGTNERVRIEAKEVIHLYNLERITQNRGYPWIAPVLLSLAHVKEYTKSELIASRVASSKMGFFTKPAGSEDTVGDYEVEQGGFAQEAQPGMFDVLPEGWQVQTFDPQNPNSSYSQFIKTILESVASGLGIAYHSLSGDLSSANYSSLRQGALEEREFYAETQQWLIERFLTPVFEAWLTNVLAFSLEGVRLPLSKYDTFNAPIWRPRTWNWVDPAKEMSALQIALKENLRSRTDIARQFGLDYITEVLPEIAAEQAAAAALGVVIEPSAEQTVAPATELNNSSDDDKEDEEKPSVN